MVAITVILAAVIAAFVFGLAGTTGSSKNVGLTAAKNGTGGGFDVTVQGGTDLPTLDSLEASNDGFDKAANITTLGSNPYSVGQTFWTGNWDNTGVKLSIRGTFSDGSQQVLFDRQF